MKKEKLIIYQVFPRIFTNMTAEPEPDGTLERNGAGKMNDFDDKLLKSIRSLKDYYDIAAEIASDVSERMNEFQALVERTHKAGMKVLIDFVPNHTARRYCSDAAPIGVEDFGGGDDTTRFFSPDNNYYYLTNQKFQPSFPIGDYCEFPAKATGNDCYSAFPGVYDWYETVKLNYGFDPGNGCQTMDPIPDTWLKMLNILRFWASKGIDGFRCDMIFMVPQVFWHWAIPQVKKDYPDMIFIGEIYDISLYRPFLDYCCFDYLYDKVNLYDTLVGIQTSSWSAARLTGCWQSLEGISPRMLNFLENHDEVRFGSKAYAGDPSLVIPSLIVSSMINTGPFMLYYGQEIGESALDNEGFAGDNDRTTIFDFWSYDTMRRWYNGGKCSVAGLTQKEKWLRRLYSKVLHLCNSEKAICMGTFFDLMYVNYNNPRFNPHRQYAFLRRGADAALLVVVNFDSQAVDVEVNIPRHAFDTLQMEPRKCRATELLTGRRAAMSLTDSEPVRCALAAHGAAIWRFPLPKVKKDA